MKTPKLVALLLMVAATPFAVYAASDLDNKIEDAAKASYNYRTILHDQVNVKAKDGVVTLTGKVQDDDLKKLAEDTVRGLPGVLNVNNQIRTEAMTPEHSDDWIAIKIRTNLFIHANVSATNTDVAVMDGVVTLTGKADSMAQKELTTAYAKDIEGVKEVNNDIVVTPPPAPPERTAGEVVDDSSITAQVKYALMTHHSTSALKTNVTTKDGVVHLEGNVGSEAEKTLAAKLAANVRGVNSVNNDLVVDK